MSEGKKDIKFCSVVDSKTGKPCGSLGYFRFVDKSGGEMVVCGKHHEDQQKIELGHALRMLRLGRTEDA